MPGSQRWTRDLNPTVRALASIILIVFLIMTMRLGQNGLVKGWTRKKRFFSEFSPFLVSVTTFEWAEGNNGCWAGGEMYQPLQWTSHLRQPSIDVWETKIERPGQKTTSWVQFHQDGGRCEPVCIHRRCPSPSDICGRPRAKAARDGFHYVLYLTLDFLSWKRAVCCISIQ